MKLTGNLLQQLLKEADGDREGLLVPVYGGRFQPFHPGHFAVWQYAIKRLGSCWIAASDKVDNKDSWLNFAERSRVMTRLFNVDAKWIIQSKNPAFMPSELLDKFKNPVYVAVTGQKDLDRYQRANYTPYSVQAVKDRRDGKTDQPLVYVVPPQSAGLAAEDLRTELAKQPDDAGRLAILRKTYPVKDEPTFKLMIEKLPKNDTK